MFHAVSCVHYFAIVREKSLQIEPQFTDKWLGVGESRV